MNAELLRHKITAIFGEKIQFNREFSKRAVLLGNQEQNLLAWCVQVKERKIEPIPSSVGGNSIVFIKKLGSLHSIDAWC